VKFPGPTRQIRKSPAPDHQSTGCYCAAHDLVSGESEAILKAKADFDNPVPSLVYRGETVEVVMIARADAGNPAFEVRYADGRTTLRPLLAIDVLRRSSGFPQKSGQAYCHRGVWLRAA